MDTTARSFGGTALHVIWDELFIAKLLESRPAVAELFQQSAKCFHGRLRRTGSNAGLQRRRILASSTCSSSLFLYAKQNRQNLRLANLVPLRISDFR
jgi:hypothetical protein